MFQNIVKSVGRLIMPADNVRVLVLGHQKTGTTAIASLLGKVSGLDVSIDPLFQIDRGKGEVVEKLFEHPDMLRMLCKRHPNLFGRCIVKDPDLTFIIPSVQKCYRNARFLFVVRDPRDTIRSICNRLGLAGTALNSCPKVSEMTGGTRHWELLLSGCIPKLEEIEKESASLVLNLAHRWNHAAEIISEYAGEAVLLRYEDFVKDKEKSIVRAAEDIGLLCTTSIIDYVDVQYQPKGNSKTDWHTFFERDNLCLIEKICAERMREFGYSPASDCIF